MSYDLQIGIPDLLPPSVVQEWAARRGLRVEEQNSIYDAEGWLFDLGHPLPMEPEEFAEEYEAARLGLRWQLGITSSFAREHVELALSVAQTVAEATGGAAFDYQAGCLLWPEGAMDPEDLMEGPHPTVRRLNLMWAVPARHWAHAGGRVPGAPGAFTPEYGTWHGPPFFGGRWAPPAPDVGVIELDMDADAIAPEDAVELFATLARDLKAFFAAAQVEPGWTVRDGRLHGIAEEWHQRRQPVLRGRTWRGLPPVPVWLSWYGGAYRDLVLPHLDAPFARAEETVAPDGRRGVFRRRGLEATVHHEPGGVLLRLGERPLSPAQLGEAWPLPEELTYRHRTRWVKPRHSRATQITAVQEDPAPVIPSL